MNDTSTEVELSPGETFQAAVRGCPILQDVSALAPAYVPRGKCTFSNAHFRLLTLNMLASRFYFDRSYSIFKNVED